LNQIFRKQYPEGLIISAATDKTFLKATSSFSIKKDKKNNIKKFKESYIRTS